MFLAAMVVAGTWFAATHLPTSEARAESTQLQHAPQEVLSVAIDTPQSTRESRRLPLAELRSLITTRPGEQLDAFKLEADRRAIEDALVARGYLGAHVASPSVTFAKAGGAYVVFDVDRGAMYHLRSITVTGPGEHDAGVVTLSTGDDAVRSRLERARQALAEVLANRASKSRVELHVHEDPATASLDVELATTEVVVMRSSVLAPVR